MALGVGSGLGATWWKLFERDGFGKSGPYRQKGRRKRTSSLEAKFLASVKATVRASTARSACQVVKIGKGDRAAILGAVSRRWSSMSWCGVSDPSAGKSLLHSAGKDEDAFLLRRGFITIVKDGFNRFHRTGGQCGKRAQGGSTPSQSHCALAGIYPTDRRAALRQLSGAGSEPYARPITRAGPKQETTEHAMYSGDEENGEDSQASRTIRQHRRLK